MKEYPTHNVFSISDWAAERKYFGRFYISQGFNKNHEITNDCGPSTLAMLINLFLFQENLSTPPVKKEQIESSSHFSFYNRIPKWIPRYGGATSPWGMVRAFNTWAQKLNISWTAERKSHARRAHVLENLLMGKPATVLKIWENGGGHWVNVVRYSSEKEKIYYLDPNPYLEHLSEEKRLQSQTWAEFEKEWARNNWWTRLLGIKKELIFYSRGNE